MPNYGLRNRVERVTQMLELGSRGHKLELDKLLFRGQLGFGASSARQRTAVCSRRAGKTVGCAAALTNAAMARPNSVALYLTLSRINAKRIVWQTLLNLNREFSLGGNPVESELRIQYPNSSNIYLAGASDKSEIEKFRGLPISIVVIDEAQSFPGYLKNLVDEVLAPALMDFDGSIALIGTPAPVPAGYFYDCSRSAEWEHHEWTVFDNPWIEKKSGRSPEQHLASECKRRGVSREDPIVQREWFGKWVHDPNSLVFAFDAARNGIGRADLSSRAPGLDSSVIGIDLGFDDADAISVLSWNDSAPDIYLTREWIGRKQTISALIKRVSDLYEEINPLAVVADTGGLGKKIADEIRTRAGIPVEAADKARKLEHIELLNDSLRTGQFHAAVDSRFASDCLLVEWDKTNPEKPKISDRFHSDICDSVLYAYMRALHWTHRADVDTRIVPGSDAWVSVQEDEMRQSAVKEFEIRRGPVLGVEDPSNWESVFR